jgi:hypothetical protein
VFSFTRFHLIRLIFLAAQHRSQNFPARLITAFAETDELETLKN